MALPTPGVTAPNWGAQLNAEITAAQSAAILTPTRAGNYITQGYEYVQTTLNVNEAYATPLVVGARGASFDQVAIRCSSAGAAGAVVRLGAYGDSAAYAYPGDLIADWGTVDTTSIGDKTITISWSPVAGLYWLVAAPQVASSGTHNNQGGTSGTPMGLPAGTLANITTGNITGFNAPSVSGALPSTWTSTLNERYTTMRICLRAA